MGRLLVSVALLALSARIVSSQDPPKPAACGPGKLCGEESPCCSQYGECGVGAFCLGGCDPRYSNSLESCVPAPVCEDKKITFKNMDRLVDHTKYLGDPTDVDFVYSGSPAIYKDQVLLRMPAESAGTLLASTTYMWYGRTSAKLTTSGGQGVVTAFILLSDVKDEIDIEFVGYNMTQAQSNYYFQGVLDYGQGKNHSVSSDTMTQSHTYTIDWTTTEITWYIDDEPVRTVKRDDTWNATDNKFYYPQSPARVQLSLWPAGKEGNPEGTVDWAGGPISWDSRYMQNGYYFSAFSEVTMECYDPPAGVSKSGGKSYIITDPEGINTTFSITDKDTVLKTLQGTGTNMTAGEVDDDDTTNTTANVPGVGSVGSGNNGNRGTEGSFGEGSETSSSDGASTTDFVQGGGNGNRNAGAMVAANERVLKGSLLAVIIALVAVVVL